MSYDNPPAVQDLPTAPQRGQPEQTFTQNANAFTSALAPWKTDLVALADWMRSVGDTVRDDRDTAKAARDAAQQAESGAQSAKSEAESAREAAIDAADAYASIADGLSATSDGDYFRVVDGGFLSLYLNDAGSAEFVAKSSTVARDELLERVERDATLLLDFAGNRYRIYEGLADGNTEKPYSQIVTHTRASDASGFNALGTLSTVTADTQRLVYSPETGRSEGLLVEEERTNLLLWSEDLTQGLWESSDTITSNSTNAPDGTLSADEITEKAEESQHDLSQSIGTVSVGDVFTVSVFAKVASGSRNIALHSTGEGYPLFDIVNGVLVDTAGQESTIDYVGDGWYRLTTTVTKSNTDGRFYLLLYDGTTNVYTGDGTSGIYIWGFQVEKASTPSSYIKTEGTAVTRAADVVSQTEVDKWLKDGGTLVVTAKVPSGETVISLGSQSITSDSDERKTYTLDIDGESQPSLEFGNGTFSKLYVVPYSLSASEIEAIT